MQSERLRRDGMECPLCLQLVDAVKQQQQQPGGAFSDADAIDAADQVQEGGG